MRLIKKIILKYQLEVLTGLHIGGNKESVEIGGLDKTVIRRGIDNQPYIPGSSLKGKIRCLLEQIAGASKVGGNREINSIFGYSGENLPSKLIFRDAYLDNESLKQLHESEYTDLDLTEVKFENSIKRVEGTADNPRQVERVPAGAKFNVEIVVNVWDNDVDGRKSIEMLERGIKALVNDYLGGNGSRGYGQVKLQKISSQEVTL
ncbi:MAG: CRISPR-associated protein Csm3 [Bacteroidales bacterium]|jgi:CRISPR-associated protein Csm3|nr:CRISPR-associated protein Csm3 [Bacteroidales bacterium]MDN5330556.1 CRISPR-associated protein Csm3 [Bacteroidales bacterium]NPV36977.1 type III-A CRISPR-associated RAMP protein Csm3 [Bacteroidales bacterium]